MCNVVTGVIVLTALVNPFRLYKLDRVEKFVMSYGGLRGAVAFALVLLINPKHVKLQPMFVTTTIAVIYFTVFFQVLRVVNDSLSSSCDPAWDPAEPELFLHAHLCSQGITIKPLVKILNVKRAEKRKPTMNERIHERVCNKLHTITDYLFPFSWTLDMNTFLFLQFMDHTMAGIEDILGHHGNHHVRDR